jgi:uncharacterized membrane protein YqjE
MPVTFPPSESTTADLLRRATTESLELLRLELVLARDELRRDARDVGRLAILLAVALVAAALGFASLVLSLGLAIGPWGALGLGAGLLVVAAAVSFVAARRFPPHLLASTTRRLAADRSVLEKHPR